MSLTGALRGSLWRTEHVLGETGPAWTTGAGTKSQGCCRIHSWGRDGQACSQSHRHTCLLLGSWLGRADHRTVQWDGARTQGSSGSAGRPNRYPCLRKPGEACLPSRPWDSRAAPTLQLRQAQVKSQSHFRLRSCNGRSVSRLLGALTDMSPLRSLGGQDCSQNITGQGWNQATGLPQTLQSGWSQCACLRLPNYCCCGRTRVKCFLFHHLVDVIPYALNIHNFMFLFSSHIVIKLGRKRNRGRKIYHAATNQNKMGRAVLVSERAGFRTKLSGL